MTNRFIDNFDYSSRFRILKGGKISLVTTALLMALSTSSLMAAVGDIVITDTTFRDGNAHDIYTTDGALALSWSSNAVTFDNATVNHQFSANPTSDPMTSITVNGTDTKTINLGVSSNLNQFNLEGSGTLLTLMQNDSNNGTNTRNTTVNNYGNIVKSSYSTSPTINIQLNDYGETTNNIFNNYGTVSAADELDSNGGVINSGSAISNYDSSLTLNNSGTINGKIESPMGGIVINNSGATINGYINVGGMGARLENSGLVNLKSIVMSSNTFYGNYIRDFTNKVTGTLQINLDTDGTEQGTTYTKLETSSATFEDGSTINVNVSDTSTNVGLLAGTTLTDVISTLNPITVGETLNITDNSALLKFEYIINGVGSDAGNTTIDLKAVKESTILDETRTGLGNKNAQKFAQKLDFINDNIGQYTAMTTIINQLNALTTSEQIAHAVESLNPQINTNTTKSMNVLKTQTTNMMSSRLDLASNTTTSSESGINTGDEMVYNDKSFWVKPFGSTGTQSSVDGINGFDVKSYGIGMGVDGKNKDDQVLGLGLFLSHANVDMNGVNQDSKANGYTVALYGSTPTKLEKTTFSYQTSYTWQNTDTSREVFTGDIATASFTSKMFSLDGRLTKDYKVNDVLVQPSVFATYKNFKTPSYSETGAGSANLVVESSSSSEMIVGIGSNAVYKVNGSDKFTGSVNVGYDTRDDKSTTVSSFQGSGGVTIESDGIDNGRWSYDLGVSYDKFVNEKSNINFSYNYQGEGSDFTNHVVSLNYNYKF